MPFWKQHAKCLTILLVLAAGVIIVSPYTNFQDYLAQGDHGRDLYAAQAVYRGELPYRDFWWVYGPLTPYYYGLFFKIFGAKISSMILGKLLIRLLCGALICLGLMQVASPLAAFLCGCWFMLFQQDFFFTYNHICGIAMVLGIVFCLLGYIKNGLSNWAWGALGFTFILCLIKINFGVVGLVMSLVTVAVCDAVRRMRPKSSKKLFYIAALIGLPLMVFAIYWSLLHGLSAMEIRQCLPYKEGDQPYSTSPWVAIGNFLQITWHTMTSSWMNKSFAVIINASFLYCGYLVVKNKLPQRKNFLLSLGMLGVFYVFNSHEYIKSGVWYRDFWSQPLSMMIIFLLIDTAIQNIPHVARKIVFSFIGMMAIICWFYNLQAIGPFKTESHLLDLPRGGIYITNAPDWITTVEQTTDFLGKTLKPNELFFALPYDCLYYYLTGKKTPTRQLIFFEHIKIPLEQEKSVLADLERNHVNYALVSSRAFARAEPGLGLLGVTYCPLIGHYLADNFVVVARFGDWHDEPGWAWNHGTMIMKRKVPYPDVP